VSLKRGEVVCFGCAWEKKLPSLLACCNNHMGINLPYTYNISSLTHYRSFASLICLSDCPLSLSNSLLFCFICLSLSVLSHTLPFFLSLSRSLFLSCSSRMEPRCYFAGRMHNSRCLSLLRASSCMCTQSCNALMMKNTTLSF
jgi:hypothetical protein